MHHKSILNKKQFVVFALVVALVTLSMVVEARDWTPYGNIDMKGVFMLLNLSNLTMSVPCAEGQILKADASGVLDCGIDAQGAGGGGVGYWYIEGSSLYINLTTTGGVNRITLGDIHSDDWSNFTGLANQITNFNFTAEQIANNSIIVIVFNGTLALNSSLQYYLLLTDQRYNETHLIPTHFSNLTDDLNLLNGTEINETIETLANYTSHDGNLTIIDKVIRWIPDWVLSIFYQKTEIDTQGEVESIWGVNLANDEELIQNCTDATCNITNIGTLDGYEASALLDDTDTHIELNITTIHNQTGKATVNETWANIFIQSIVTQNYVIGLGFATATIVQGWIDGNFTFLDNRIDAVNDSININDLFPDNNLSIDIDTDSNASTACSINGDGYYLDSSGFCIHFNNTVLAITASTTYNASSIATIDGTVNQGDIESLKGYKDGNSYNVSEEANKDWIIYINYTGIVSFTGLLLRTWYGADDNKNHDGDVCIWDWVDSVWDCEYEPDIPYTDEFKEYSYFVFDPEKHIGTGVDEGNVLVSIQHDNNGDKGRATHDFRIDYAVLVDGFSAMTTTAPPTLQQVVDANPNLDSDIISTADSKWQGINVTDNVTADWIKADIESDRAKNPPSDCPSSNAVTGWGDNLSTSVCSTFLANPALANQDMGGNELYNVSDIRVRDSNNETHLLSVELQIRDEMYRNVTLSGLNGTLIGNNLTISTLSGNSIVVNIETTEKILNRNTDSIILTEGTNETPILNQVYYTDKDNPILAKRTTLSEEVPSVATFVLGANFSYASIIGGTTANNIVRGIYNRWLDQGAIYKSGFDINVTTEEINLTSGVMKILLSKLDIKVNHSTSVFYVHVHTDGSFHQHTNLDNCSTYSGGESISNNKFFNVVCGMTYTHDEEGVMYCVTQDKPDSEHTKAIDAQLDVDFLRIFPPHDIIKLAYIPIVRVVVKRSGGDNTIQTLTTGKLFLDLRGTITASAGSTPSPGITDHNDLSNLNWASAAHTIDADVDMGGYGFDNGGQFNFTGGISSGTLLFTGTNKINFNTDSESIYSGSLGNVNIDAGNAIIFSGSTDIAGNTRIVGNLGLGVTPHATFDLDVLGTSRLRSATEINETLYINENVGIGIINPLFKFQVEGDTLLNGSLNASDEVYFHGIVNLMKKADVGELKLRFLPNGTLSPSNVGWIMDLVREPEGNSWILATITGATSNEKMTITASGNVIYTENLTLRNGKWIGISATEPRIEFDSTNDDLALLNADVGIGTASPEHLLDVGGMEGIGAPGNLGIKSNSGAWAIRIEENSGVEGWHIGVDVDGDLNFDDSNTGIRLTFQDETGNIGIGTTSPGRDLEIYDSSPALRIRDSGATASATTAFIEFGGTDATAWNRTGHIGDGSSGNADIYLRAGVGDLHLGDSNGATVLNLQDGNVGIGTTEPNSSLHVVGGNATIEQGVKILDDYYSIYGTDNDFKIGYDTGIGKLVIDGSGAFIRMPSGGIEFVTNAISIGEGPTKGEFLIKGQTVKFQATGFVKSVVFDLSGNKFSLLTAEAVMGDGSDYDFRVRTNNEDYMIVADGGNDRVGFATKAPQATVDINGTFRVSGKSGARFNIAYNTSTIIYTSDTDNIYNLTVGDLSNVARVIIEYTGWVGDALAAASIWDMEIHNCTHDVINDERGGVRAPAGEPMNEMPDNWEIFAVQPNPQADCDYHLKVDEIEGTGRNYVTGGLLDVVLS